MFSVHVKKKLCLYYALKSPVSVTLNPRIVHGTKYQKLSVIVSWHQIFGQIHNLVHLFDYIIPDFNQNLQVIDRRSSCKDACGWTSCNI